MEYSHQPVLLEEVTELLIGKPDGIYVDGTVGNGGHSQAIGEKITSEGRLICLDMDSEAVRISKERLSSLSKKLSLFKANYVELAEILKRLGIEKVDGIFLDLGLSSYQLEHSGRGFSFSRDEPLDMRMDSDNKLTAHEVINTFSSDHLERILREYGEEKWAKRIVKTVEEERKRKPIKSSLELANLVIKAIPVSHHPKAKHPATRTFQALRIAVNKELENLKTFLDMVPFLMNKGGRIAVLSYHSLEDRMIKQTMLDWEKQCTCPPDLPKCACGKVSLFKRLNKRGIRPKTQEIHMNPRARSATLRGAERV
ncbi:MAG: 16S rRNA (cytosine(1402)-N(4))-methyltransferase RsmH [Deltaproteobacteria bacterium]|nr:16S rRNA (cytosine(1402)-N(4))-methyltransferase RsmH [Deltaproteobacteria bacterium]